MRRAPTSVEPRVLHTVARLSVGGINSLLLENLRAMGGERHVCVVTQSLARIDEYRATGVEPVSLGHRGWYDSVRTLVRAVRLLRRERFDVVHVNHALDALFFGLAARLTGVPTVVSLHSVGRPDPKEARMMRVATRRASRFVAVSRAVADAGVATYGVPAELVDVIYSGVDTMRFRPDEADRDRRRDVPGSRLITVGRLHPVKRQRALIRMMEKLAESYPDVQLEIVGEGEMRAELEAELLRSPARSRVHLLGARKDVDELLRAADVYVSASSVEGFSMAAVEAMSSGLPVVAVDIAPMREAVAPGCGVLVADVDQLAPAVASYLDDPARRAAEGERARRVVLEEFSSQSAAQQLVALYRAVAHGRHSVGARDGGAGR